MKIAGVRKVLRNLGTPSATGSSDRSNQPGGDPATFSIDDIRLGLGSTGSAQELDWGDISRIQDRILGSLDDPEPADEPLTDESIHRMIDASRAELLLIEPATLEQAKTDPDPQPPTRQQARALTRRLVAVLAGFLALSAIFPITRNSMPGDVLFPAKLQVEQVRLAMAEGLDRAEVQLTIGHDRLRSIGDRSPTAYSTIRALGDVEAAELDAVDLIIRATPSPRRGRLAGLLAELARKHIRQVSVMPMAPGGPALAKSKQMAEWVLEQITPLLRSPSSIASPPAEALVSNTAASKGQLPSRGLRSHSPAASLTPAGSSSERPAQATTSEPARQPDDDEGCMASSGSICVTVPRPEDLLPN